MSGLWNLISIPFSTIKSLMNLQSGSLKSGISIPFSTIKSGNRRLLQVRLQDISIPFSTIKSLPMIYIPFW